VSSRGKILIVDDNSATRRMVRDALARHGHEVVEAPDGRSARELARSEQPRVVLQDLMLPDADGFQLVAELRALAPSASILAFSGFVSKFDEARVSTAGFDDIIPKPIAPSRLVPIIEAHLPQEVTAAEKFGAGRRLVVADDDPLQLKLAQFRLGRLGFEIEVAPNGALALAAIRRMRPDLVLACWLPPGNLLSRLIRAPVRHVLEIGAKDGATPGAWNWRFAHQFCEELERRARCRLDERPARTLHSRVTLYFGRSHPEFAVERVRKGDWLWQFRPRA